MPVYPGLSRQESGLPSRVRGQAFVHGGQICGKVGATQHVKLSKLVVTHMKEPYDRLLDKQTIKSVSPSPANNSF